MPFSSRLTVKARGWRLHDGFDDVRRQIPEDMRVVELEVPGNLIGVVVCAITQALHPPLRARDCKDQPMIDPSRGWLTGNDDFLSRTRLWRRHCASVFESGLPRIG
jgi:hypothetical protein